MAIPSTGLVFHLDHNDPASWPGSGSTVTDLVSGNTATLVGIGEGEGGFSFDGATSEMVFANDAGFDDVFTNGGTVAFAVRLTSDGQNSNAHLVSRLTSGAATDGWAIFTNGQSGGNVNIQLFSNRGVDGRWEVTVSLNEWHIVVIRYNSNSTANNPRVDVDGVAVTPTETSSPSGSQVSDAGRPLGIGNRAATAGRAIEGFLDTVAICDQELTDQETLDVYNEWVSRFAAAPQITNVVPTAGTNILATAELGFDLTDPGGLVSSAVYAPVATGLLAEPVRWELVHDGTSFRDGYSGTRTAISDGFRYRITRNQGWNVANPQLEIRATDSDGNEAEVAA